MKRATVVSSNIVSVGYDAPSETLEVEFMSGSIYQYYNVPQAIYDAFLRAISPGSSSPTRSRTPFRTLGPGEVYWQHEAERMQTRVGPWTSTGGTARRSQQNNGMQRTALREKGGTSWGSHGSPHLVVGQKPLGFDRFSKQLARASAKDFGQGILGAF